VRHSATIRRIASELGRGLIVLAVAGAFIGVVAVSALSQGRPGSAGAQVVAEGSDSAVPSAEAPASAVTSPEPTLEPTPDATPTEEASPTGSPTPEPTPTVAPTAVPAPVATPKLSCTASGAFGSTLSACGVEVTVGLSDDTTSDAAPADPYTQADAFVITASFSDPKFGAICPIVKVNNGDNQGFLWWPDLNANSWDSGATHRLVVYVRPGSTTRLVIGFGAAVSPSFSFS
jgi:hypothetical protein